MKKDNENILFQENSNKISIDPKFFLEEDLEKENRKNHFSELNELMPLKDKVIYSKQKIKEFINWCEEKQYNEILIAFSGGKDSTVIFDLVNNVHLEMNSKIYLVPAYAMEITFPTTLKFIKDVVEKYQKQNKYIKELLLKPPRMPWNKILSEKGYPIFSKQISVMINRLKNARTKNYLTQWAFGLRQTARFKLPKNKLFLLDDNMQIFPDFDPKYDDYFPKNLSDNYTFSEKCCTFVKGGLKNDKRPAFIGVLANESFLRKKSWIDNGCNILNESKPMSRPISLWTSDDVWNYIRKYKIVVNEAYNFNYNKANNEQELRFERLGCTSCPYGSAIEQRKINSLKKNNKIDNKFKLKNRFEKLYEYSPTLYKSQIINTGIYKVLIDMGIIIECDNAYQDLFHKRWEQINNWLNEENIRNNILKILTQIENHKNYKQYKKYAAWSYEINEINQILNYFKIFNQETNEKEMKKIREKTKEDWYKKNKIK